MKRLYSVKLTLLITIVIAFFMGGCAVPEKEGFAIYLTRGEIPPSQMPALSHVDIAEEPVIAADDIIAYNAETHEITLTASAFERISRLEVLTRGRSFLVCVDNQPVYWGAFWTPLSSLSFDGVTIMKPLGSQEEKVIKLGLGYPGPSFYRGEDPRNNPEVIEALERDGKLTH